jgi:RNA polymerase sigma factor (sigma-70 family)
MNNPNEIIPTRQSLLERLKQWDDQDGWKLFFDTYWRLIYQTALKAGLSDAEAQDAVQETVISVLKKMPGFEYRGDKGSFKAWLHQVTRWRIVDQIRKRDPAAFKEAHSQPQEYLLEAAVPDETTWAADWERNLFDAAIERVKRKVNAKLYQIFDLYVFKEWPATKIASAFGISTSKIYTNKTRISKMLKNEVEQLRFEADREAERLRKANLS